MSRDEADTQTWTLPNLDQSVNLYPINKCLTQTTYLF